MVSSRLGLGWDGTLRCLLLAAFGQVLAHANARAPTEGFVRAPAHSQEPSHRHTTMEHCTPRIPMHLPFTFIWTRVRTPPQSSPNGAHRQP